VQKFDQIQVVAAQEPYETKPDDFGVENWRAVGARTALQHVAFFAVGARSGCRGSRLR